MSAYSDSAAGPNPGRCQGRGSRASWHPVELIAMVLGFMMFWPIGLAILALKMWQRKTGESGDLAGVARTAYARTEGFAQDMARNWGRNGPVWQGRPAAAGTGFGRTGNTAFDDWRASELAKLEEQRRKLVESEREFAEHIDGLRRARDREEFERFMQARGHSARSGDDTLTPHTGA